MCGTNGLRQMLGNGWEEKKLPVDIRGRGKESPLCDSRTQQPAVGTLPQPMHWEEQELIKMADRFGVLKTCCASRRPQASSQSYQEGPAGPPVAILPIGTHLPARPWLSCLAEEGTQEPFHPSHPESRAVGLPDSLPPFHPLVYHHPVRAKRSQGPEGSSHMQSCTSPLAAQTQPGVSCSRTKGQWRHERGDRSAEGQRTPFPTALGIFCVPGLRWSPLQRTHQKQSGTDIESEKIRIPGREGGREGGREAGQVPLPSVIVTDTTGQLGTKEAGCQGRAEAELGPCQLCGDSGRCCPGGREETLRFGVSTRASD